MRECEKACGVDGPEGINHWREQRVAALVSVAVSQHVTMKDSDL